MMKKSPRYTLKSSRLFCALEKFDLSSMLKAISDGENVEIRDRDGNTPLVRACFLGRIDLLNTLITFNPDINAVNDLGWSGLHFAAQENHVNIVKVMVSLGATIDIQDHYGNTPLWRAVFSNSQQVVDFLISVGASLDVVNNHGVSPRKLLQP